MNATKDGPILILASLRDVVLHKGPAIVSAKLRSQRGSRPDVLCVFRPGTRLH